MEKLSASVGKVGSNRPDDVITIKRLLNRISPAQGGAGGELVENSQIRAGDETVAAIIRFQTTSVPGIKPDGVVSPGGKTWARLIELSQTRPSGKTIGEALGEPLSVAGDPAKHPKYIENAIKSIGVPIWGGAFWLYQSLKPSSALDNNSVQLDRRVPYLDSDPLANSGVLQHVYKSRDAADLALQSLGAGMYTYYVGAGGHFYPTVISDTSAPALCEAMRRMLALEKSEAAAASKLGVDLLLWAAGLRFPLKLSKPATTAEISALAWQKHAKLLVEAAKKSGKPVRVNLAGAGEWPDAINLNKLVDQQVKNIPNLVKGSAEDVAKFFDRGVIDQIASNNVVLGQVNWTLAAKGSFTVLKRGGSISISPYAGQLDEHLVLIVDALRRAGFKNVAIQSGRFVTAVKP